MVCSDFGYRKFRFIEVSRELEISLYEKIERLEKILKVYQDAILDLMKKIEEMKNEKT